MKRALARIDTAWSRVELVLACVVAGWLVASLLAWVVLKGLAAQTTSEFFAGAVLRASVLGVGGALLTWRFSKRPFVTAVSLGAGEVTALDITAAYAAFVNGGRRVDPYLIEYVQDRDGETIYRADQRRCRDCGRAFSGQASPYLDPRGTQVIDPITAYQISSMLEGVIQRGTAASARGLGRWVGGKTGTTNEYRSAWFVGFTTDIVVGVYIGFDDNRSLGSGEAGASAAVPIFVDFMEDALRERPARPFVRPRGAIFRTVNGFEEAFRPGTERRREEERRETVAVPEGPQNYNEVVRREQEAAAGITSGPSAPPPTAPPAPKQEPAADLDGLF